MKKNWVTKAIAFGIIVIFVGASVLSSTKEPEENHYLIESEENHALYKYHNHKENTNNSFQQHNYVYDSSFFSKKMYSTETAYQHFDPYITHFSKRENIFQNEILINNDYFSPGEIIVKFEDFVNINEICFENGLLSIDVPSLNILFNEEYTLDSFEEVFYSDINSHLKNSDLKYFYKLSISEDQDIIPIINRLNSESSIAYASPNHIMTTYTTPNDPYYHTSGSWGQNYQDLYGIHLTINSADTNDNAWDVTTGSADIIVAVVDTGVDYNHDDLADNIWYDSFGNPGWNFINNTGYPIDGHGHGTHCAGTIAAVGNNAIGVVGMNWHVKIMALKGLSDHGGGSSTNLANAIVWAANNGAHVISNSWGPSGRLPSNPVIEAAVRYAYNAGSIVVFAAGNNNDNVKYYSPQNMVETITVAATDHNDQKAWFSNYGGHVSVCAPGVDILSLRAENTSMGNPVNSGYTRASGTSMACPHVAGLAALILSNNPSYSPIEVETVIRSTIDEIYSNEYVGIGRINANSAVRIDDTPIAKLNVSFNDEVVQGTISLNGSASGNSFIGYTLYYGEGFYPYTWVSFYNSTSPVYNDELALLDTTYLPDGVYTIRLLVDDSYGRTSEDRVIITVNYNYISYPLNNDIFRAGDIIEIIGNVNASSFLNYSIHWGVGDYPSEWFTTGITLTNNGQELIVDDILANWDTNFVINKGIFTLRLTVNSILFQSVDDIKDIYLDPSLKEGWPKRVYGEWGEEYQEPIGVGSLFMPVVSDLNNNNFKEVIIYKGGDPPKLYVFNYLGELLPNFPIEIEPTSGRDGHPPLPIVADINNDGFNEIIVFRPKNWAASYDDPPSLLIYNYSGVLLDKFNVSYPELHYGFWEFASGTQSLTLADLNHDGNLEIIILGASAVTVLDSSGNTLEGWPKQQFGWIHGTHESSPAVGNFDDDDDLEIVIAVDWAPEPNSPCENKGMIYVYKLDGTILWQKETKDYSFSSPSVGDITGDGNNEIVVGFLGVSQEEYGIYVYDKFGDVLDGWPQLQGKRVWSNPVIGDFFNDQQLQIVVSDLATATYMFNADGSLIDGWPQYMSWFDWFSPVIGDVSGDGIPDVVTNNNYLYGSDSIYAWNRHGQLIEGFPKRTGASVGPSVTLADVDNDGQLDLIAGSNIRKSGDNYLQEGTIYIWELNSEYNPIKMPWPTFHHDNQRTGKYSSLELIPDLGCAGSLNWGEVEPGSTTTGTFIVSNSGDPGSLLDWKIDSYPNWGSWTFTPSSGEGLLTPEDGPVTVDVEVKAPMDKNTEFTGQIVLVNSDDPDNTCTIDVALATPVSYQSQLMMFVQRFVQRFPNAFPVLKLILGI